MVKVIAFVFLALANFAQSIDYEKITDWSKGIKSDKVLFAINCGAEEVVTDDYGITYQADSYYQGGVASTEGSNHRWLMSNNAVYMSERYGLGEDFSYKIPMEGITEGKFTIILKFSEIYFWEPGMKVFDVAIGDKTLVKDFDILASAG